MLILTTPTHPRDSGLLLQERMSKRASAERGEENCLGIRRLQAEGHESQKEADNHIRDSTDRVGEGLPSSVEDVWVLS